MTGAHDREGEAGFSVVELAVVLALLGVVLAAVLGSFSIIQQTTTNNLVRQQGFAQAQLAMQVVSRDIRATADDQTRNIPLIDAMSATSMTMKSNIDTTVNVAVAGNASAFNGCPDQVTITGSATPGPITETRIHPDSVATDIACHWPAAPLYTRAVATRATLSLVYLAWSDPTLGVAPAAGTPTTTASVQVTITVPPSNKSSQLPSARLVQTVALATYTNYRVNLPA